MPDSPQAAEFSALLTPIFSRVYAVAHRLSGNADEAADLVQDASIRAFRGFESFQKGTNFKAWFLRILVNVFLNSRRKIGREAPTVNLDDAEDLFLYQQAVRGGLSTKKTDPAARLLAKVEGEQVAGALAKLSEEFRVVAALYFLEGLSYDEIAQILEIPIGTVRSRLHRARKVLQKELWELARERGLV